MTHDTEIYFLVKIFHDMGCNLYKNGVDYTAGLNYDFCCIIINLN